MIPLDSLGPVHYPSDTERATIRGNLRALARDEADAELLVAALGVGER